MVLTLKLGSKSEKLDDDTEVEVSSGEVDTSGSPEAGTLTLESIPSGATITNAADELVGTTPLTIPLDDSIDALFSFALEGYEVHQLVVQAEAGEVKVESVVLVRKSSVSCLFETFPAGATVTDENDKELGITPLEIEVPLKSEMKVKATLTHYKPMRAKLIGRANCGMKVQLNPQ